MTESSLLFFQNHFLLLLAGLTAILIPVIIHLFNRTRYQVTKWAAMEFLLSALKRTRKRVRLENLLILLLRILALLLLAGAVAQPFLGSHPGAVSEKRLHLVVVLDNSYSMAAQRGETTALERAIGMVDSAIAEGTIDPASGLSLIRTTDTFADYFREGEDPGAGGRALTAEEELEAQTLRARQAELREEIDVVLASANGDEVLPPDPQARLDELQAELGGIDARLAELTSPDEVTIDAAAAAALFTTDHGAVRRKLRETRISAAESDWTTALELTRRALEAGRDRFDVARVVVLTDCQKRNFPTAESGSREGFRTLLGQVKQLAGGNLAILDTGSALVHNHAIQRASLVNPVVGVGVPIRIQVTVTNTSIPRGEGNPTENLVQVKYAIDGGRKRPLTRIPDVAPGQTRTVLLQQNLPAFNRPGTHTLTLSLEDDDLSLDNTYHLVVDVREAIRVLAIDGDPGEYADRSEVFLFTLGLQDIYEDVAGNERWKRKTRIRIDTTNLVGLTGVDFFEYDMLVMANVLELSPGTLQAIERYVRAGNPLLVTLGDNINEQFYRETLFAESGLLPARPAQVEEAHEMPTHMRVVDEGFPPLVPLLTQDRENNQNFVGAPLYHLWYHVEAPVAPRPDYHVILELDNEERSPLLVRHRVGLGQVYLFTSSLDGDWNSLFYMPAGIPFWQETVYTLTEIPNRHKHLLVGDPYRRPIGPQEYSQSIFVFPPDADPRRLETGMPVSVRGLSSAGRENAYRGMIPFDATDTPGVYTLRIFKNLDTLRSLLLDVLETTAGVAPVARRGLAEEMAQVLAEAPAENREPTLRDILVEAAERGDIAPVVLLERSTGEAIAATTGPERTEIARRAAEALSERLLDAAVPLLSGPEVRAVTDRFAVNLHTEESDVERLGLDAEMIQAALDDLAGEPAFTYIRAGGGAETDEVMGVDNPLASRDFNLWRFFVFALLFFLVIEMLAALVFGARQR